jgi:glycosyltransferase involved in cell wall biosynthesis
MLKADLSVIITNYNKPHEWIMECVDSVKNQTVPVKEIILVDDCSSDPRAHAACTSIILPKNKGVANARDVGVRQSTGRLLLFLDADDKLSIDFVERCGEKIKDADIVYTDYILTGAVERNLLKTTPSKLTPKLLMANNCPIRLTSMMKRHVYYALGGFANLAIFEDWDFYLRAMALDFKFDKAKSFFEYRQSKQASRIKQSKYLKEEVYKKIISQFTIERNKLCPNKIQKNTVND